MRMGPNNSCPGAHDNLKVTRHALATKSMGKYFIQENVCLLTELEITHKSLDHCTVAQVRGKTQVYKMVRQLENVGLNP